MIAAAESALAGLLKHELEQDGHQVQCVSNAAAALGELTLRPPGLLVLDLALDSPPDLPLHLPTAVTPASPRLGKAADDRFRELARLRAVDRDVPILVLTACREVQALVDCLDYGADDCMFKPLSIHELRARCRALLRRRRGAELVLRCEGIELDRISRRVEQQGRAVPLTNTEFALLEYLMMHPGSCVSRAALLAEVWNHGMPEPHGGRDTNVVDVYINYLRRKLGSDKASVIRTVRGRGYLVGATRVPGSALAEA